MWFFSGGRWRAVARRRDTEEADEVLLKRPGSSYSVSPCAISPPPPPVPLNVKTLARPRREPVHFVPPSSLNQVLASLWSLHETPLHLYFCIFLYHYGCFGPPELTRAIRARGSAGDTLANGGAAVFSLLFFAANLKATRVTTATNGFAADI